MVNEKYKVSITNKEKKEEYSVELNKSTEKHMFYYKEPNKTACILDYENNILKRDNEEMMLEIHFIPNEKTNNKIYIKELNNSINLEIFTKEITKEEDKYIVIYESNNEEFIYKIEKED